MTSLRQIYRCEVCGNVVEIVNEGAPALVCCSQPMNELNPKTQDDGKEKHVPVVTETQDGVKVTVGSVEHPMTDEHYIKFIEVLTAEKVLRAELKPGVTPSAEFKVKNEDVVEVREFCTLHMLWKV